MLNFSKMIVRYDWLLCNMCVSVLQKSRKDLVSLEELPAAQHGLVGFWAMNQQIFTTICCDSRCVVLD